MRSPFIFSCLATLGLWTLSGAAAAQPTTPPAARAPTVDSGSASGAELAALTELGDVVGIALVVDEVGGTVAVSTVDAGPWATLGLRAGDVVLTINGQPMASRADVARLASDLRHRTVAYVEVVRQGKPVLLRRVVDAPLPLPAPGTPDPALDAALDKLIRQIDATTYEVDVDALTANPMQYGRGARVMPSSKAGVPNGFKIYAVRPSSLYARLGLQNGDTVHRANGHALDSMDRTLEVYAQVRTADKVVVELTRRGKPVTLTYVRRAPATAPAIEAKPKARATKPKP